MVRKKSAWSLRTLSCRRLADNLCNVWNSKIRHPDPNLRNNLLVVTEYLKLPSTFGEMLLDELIARRQLQTGHILVLLELGLRRLKLSRDSCTLSAQDLIRHLSMEQLQYLQCVEIDLLHTKVISEDIPLITVTPLLPKLLELHVTNEYVNDNCVKQIVTHCPKLHTLNLRYCSISDMSIDYICNCGKGEISTNTVLQRLDILGTDVSYYGAAKALRCLPQLRQLEFSKMLRVFTYLYGSEDDVAEAEHRNCPDTHLELRTVNLTCIQRCRGYRPRTPFAESIPKVLRLISNTCPKLECLSITSDYRIPKDQLFDFALKCEQLNQLDIKFRSFRNFRTHFDSVQPALAVCGERLRKLTLCGFMTVNVPFLANTVPNLTSLSVTCNALHNDDDDDDEGVPRELAYHPNSRYKDSSAPTAFPHLEELWLQDVDQHTLEQILRLADNVQELFLLDLPAFNDSMLYKIESHLGQVRRLGIHSCEGLTLEAVKFLLALPNSLLEELKLDQTDTRPRDELLSWTQKNNLDIRITWSH